MPATNLDLWVRRFLLHLRAERNVSPHTLAAYQNDLKGFLLFLQKSEIDLSEFRQARLILREYWMSLSRRQVHSSTLIRKLASLRSFFKYLVREDQMTVNPFQYLPTPKKEKRLPDFLTEKEMGKFLSDLDAVRHPLVCRDRALIELLYSSGLRIQEAVSLNCSDIDLWNGTVRVFGKGSRERLVPVGDMALKAVRNYLE
ncbi:MAG: site-specific integrase, partial [Elusimicrobia bacterium]|nr:site-specific integrase [Elusimicrobiota bacterium]